MTPVIAWVLVITALGQPGLQADIEQYPTQRECQVAMQSLERPEVQPKRLRCERREERL